MRRLPMVAFPFAHLHFFLLDNAAAPLGVCALALYALNHTRQVFVARDTYWRVLPVTPGQNPCVQWRRLNRLPRT